MKKIIFLFIVFIFDCFLASEIINQDKPLLGDWDLKAQKVWEIGKYGEEPMASPILACVSGDGTIFMHDFKHGLHFSIDSSGKLKTSFARKGEGPGEVRFPWGYFSVDNKLIVFDRPKLHFFLADGTYQKSIPITTRSDRPGVFINENEYISYPKSDEGEIIHVNLEKGSRKVIKKISTYKDATYISRGKAVVVPWLHAEFVADYDAQNHRFYYGINDAYLINVIDSEGNMINTFSLKRQKRKVSAEMDKEYRKQNPNESEMISPEMVKSLPKELTYFRKIQITNGWVYVFVTNFAEYWDDQQIDIFSLDGKYTYRAVFKLGSGEKIYSASLFPGVFIQGNYLYTIVLDKDHDYKLVKYQISLPSS